MTDSDPPILLLDVMGTLVYEPFYVEIPAFFDMSLKQLIAEKHPTAWAEYEMGDIDEAALEAKFFRDGRPYDHQGLKDTMFEAYKWLDGMEDLLGDLREAEVEMHALSNYPEWYQAIEERLGLSRYLAWSFVSCMMGVRKPDEEAYRTPLRRLGVEPERCVFVDDREENCAAARAVGIQALRFENAQRLRAELAALGVLRY